LVFLLCYLVVLKLLTSRLRHSFPKFYRSERPTILATNFLLIGSISSRILIALLLHSLLDFVWVVSVLLLEWVGRVAVLAFHASVLHR
jgi:hypothetical protein